ncbi:hypothetical protein [Erwinia aphidicola]|uniref:hypothetical protein n=1 Tax=Erwinia aphidicola TaxID=68334 RepID=UPI0030D02A32
MSKETGGPAFPVDVDGRNYHPGQTLRDYFAGKALQGMMASLRKNDYGSCEVDGPNFAKGAYLMADYMIAARGE